jgi:hypothetical protein
MKKLLLLAIFICFILFGCATTDLIKISDYKETIWLASSESVYSFQGQFVKVRYSGVDVVGLRLEEPLGQGWKKLGINQGDIWVGISNLIYLKASDWKKVWSIVKMKLNLDNVPVGILKKNQDNEYDKELTWFILKR